MGDGMQLYEIKYSEIDCYVKFKALQPMDIEDFKASLGEVSEKDFMQAVISHFIYNINTDVKPKLQWVSPDAGRRLIQALYQGCVFLNPGLDPGTWTSLTYTQLSSSKEVSVSPAVEPEKKVEKDSKKKPRQIPRAKILSLKETLDKSVIGQDEAIDSLHTALKRSLTGLSDPEKPLGVFMFAGSSGVGKTHLAKTLHSHLFGSRNKLARIDCGEYQEKHQALTLLGAPPSYIGYDDENGGLLAQILAKNPQTVLLFDEVEKAHPSLWNVFLRMFDEGKITDSRGVTLDFRQCIIIMTTNLGNSKVVKELTGKSVGFGSRIDVIHNTQEIPNHDSVKDYVKEAIKEHFKPEFLNRVDDLIVFRHLELSEYNQIAKLELEDTSKKLSSKGIETYFDQTVVEGLVTQGVDTIQGARGMAKVRRNKIENVMADLILGYNLKKGAKFEVSYDEEFIINIAMPKQKKKA
jgi:ATP-dependent Clp protease ATP-binding subunit ClpA